MRKTALALLVAAPLGALAARAQEKTATFESAEHGFKIAAPGTAWTIAELPASDGAHFALKVARATARGEASVSVLVYDVEGAVDAEAVRELARKRWTADARCSGFESGKGPLGGTEAPFLAFHASQGEASYDYRHDYLVRDGLCYLLVTASPSSDREACAKDLEAIRARFAFVPQEGGKALEKAKRVRRLARLCGTELAWAADWNEARARAAREKKLVLVVSEIYSGFAIDPLSPSTLFMDADVVALAKER